MFHLKHNYIHTHEPLHAQNDEINGNIVNFQPYPVVAAEAQLYISTAIISAVLLLNEHLSQILFCPKILFPVGVLFYSVLPSQDTHC
jgi:hypothetical protein